MTASELHNERSTLTREERAEVFQRVNTLYWEVAALLRGGPDALPEELLAVATPPRRQAGLSDTARAVEHLGALRKAAELWSINGRVS